MQTFAVRSGHYANNSTMLPALLRYILVSHLSVSHFLFSYNHTLLATRYNHPPPFPPSQHLHHSRCDPTFPPTTRTAPSPNAAFYSQDPRSLSSLLQSPSSSWSSSSQSSSTGSSNTGLTSASVTSSGRHRSVPTAKWAIRLKTMSSRRSICKICGGGTVLGGPVFSPEGLGMLRRLRKEE